MALAAACSGLCPAYYPQSCVSVCLKLRTILQQKNDMEEDSDHMWKLHVTHRSVDGGSFA
jgi:hypothetical protein